jgi:hypothetical protein
MDAETPRGTKRAVNGQWRVYYDGYWIKAYDVPADTLLAKKRLIEALTRRLFNHVEHGLNIPGTRLDEARGAYDVEVDPDKKRVKGAMLAGALFNRATDVFTKVVEIQALGVEIHHDDALMRQCGQYLQEALALGTLVLHRSGDEGIDELWGEPFKAFAFPIEDFYKSRYIKIAQTMSAIDEITDQLIASCQPLPMFTGVERLLRPFAAAAKLRCETLHTDAEIFDIWAAFVVSAEALAAFRPALTAAASSAERQQESEGLELIRRGKELVSYITRARVPMPKSTRELCERCAHYRRLHGPGAPSTRPPDVVEAAPPARAVERGTVAAHADQHP